MILFSFLPLFLFTLFFTLNLTFFTALLYCTYFGVCETTVRKRRVGESRIQNASRILTEKTPDSGQTTHLFSSERGSEKKALQSRDFITFVRLHPSASAIYDQKENVHRRMRGTKSIVVLCCLEFHSSRVILERP